MVKCNLMLGFCRMAQYLTLVTSTQLMGYKGLMTKYSKLDWKHCDAINIELDLVNPAYSTMEYQSATGIVCSVFAVCMTICYIP